MRLPFDVLAQEKQELPAACAALLVRFSDTWFQRIFFVTEVRKLLFFGKHRTQSLLGSVSFRCGRARSTREPQIFSHAEP